MTLKGDFTPARLKEVLAGEAVNLLSAAEQTATLTLSHGGPGITMLLQKLDREGVGIYEIAMQKPSLESVFLKLTGREVRD